MAKEDYKGIWVFAEQENGIIEPTVFELIAKSKDLQAYNKEEIVAVLLGSGIENLAQDLIARGADKVIVVDDPALAQYSARPYAEALRQLIEKIAEYINIEKIQLTVKKYYGSVIGILVKYDMSYNS